MLDDIVEKSAVTRRGFIGVMLAAPFFNKIVPKTSKNIFKIGDTSVVGRLTGTGTKTYFNMHENEQTSVKAGKRIVEKYGGRLIELKHKGTRLVKFRVKGRDYVVDPNRIFTDKGIKRTLMMYSKYSFNAFNAVKSFVDDFVKFYSLDKSKSLIALHNNTNGNLSVYSFGKKDALDVYVNKTMDKDDFFYVTERKMFDSLKKDNFNVVLQNNYQVTDDGSLSVYCGKKKIPYINVEAQKGHYKEQIRMLEAI